jgi:hypothetical protein
MNSQKKFAVDQQAIVFIAGNNIELSGDLTGRFLLVDLEVREADPQKRIIHNVIDERYLSQDAVRADLNSATWGIMRAWNEGIRWDPKEKKIIKRDPRPEPSSVYRGFETFSRLFGGMVENAGYGNPMESTAAEINPDYADMMAIVERLADGVERRAEYEFRRLIDICRELNLFEWHLEGKVIKRKVVEGEGTMEVTREIEQFDLTPSNKSWFGKLFSKTYGGSMFTIPDGRRVQFGKRGENRQRLYTVEIIDAA